MTPSLPVAPEFWNRDGPTARLLGPAGYVVRTVGSLRRRLVRRTSFDVPVICVGNLVVGGAGKTPVSQSIAQMLAGRGHGVALLLRGYGGRLRGPGRGGPAPPPGSRGRGEGPRVAGAAPRSGCPRPATRYATSATRR